MTIIEITPTLELPPPKQARSEGVHGSNIIRSIALKVGFLDKKWATGLNLTDAHEITDPKAILRMRIGLAWEEHILPSLPDVVDHPGEMELQGIYMTHDGESVDRVFTGSRGYEVIVHEVKVTYKSSRKAADLKSQWMWLTQMKAYCKGLNTRYARIYILFICGDYTYPIEPEYRVFEIEFTEEEINQNWSMIADYYQHWLDGTNTVLSTVDTAPRMISTHEEEH